jgi:hypothetical protein
MAVCKKRNSKPFDASTNRLGADNPDGPRRDSSVAERRRGRRRRRGSLNCIEGWSWRWWTAPTRSQIPRWIPRDSSILLAIEVASRLSHANSSSRLDIAMVMPSGDRCNRGLSLQPRERDVGLDVGSYPQRSIHQRSNVVQRAGACSERPRLDAHLMHHAEIKV